ncbi:MAG: hypothetical protein HS116_19005 [Planctomycetes bacterium]|nr:hypothetical protein [Planctomycetota bacterium]
MNLTTPIGKREVLSYREVMAMLGLTYNQVKNLVATGRLKRRFSGVFPLHYEDVNRFIMDLNTGRVTLGRGSRKKQPA